MKEFQIITWTPPRNSFTFLGLGHVTLRPASIMWPKYSTSRSPKAILSLTHRVDFLSVFQEPNWDGFLLRNLLFILVFFAYMHGLKLDGFEQIESKGIWNNFLF